MMGESDSPATFYYNLSLETDMPQAHPLRAIRPLVDDETIRKHCRPRSTLTRDALPSRRSSCFWC